jgi:hypothetical protein
MLEPRFNIGDVCVFHVFGYEYWIPGCKVVKITFTEGKVWYTLEIPNDTRSEVEVWSGWAVDSIGAKNAIAYSEDAVVGLRRKQFRILTEYDEEGIEQFDEWDASNGHKRRHTSIAEIRSRAESIKAHRAISQETLCAIDNALYNEQLGKIGKSFDPKDFDGLFDDDDFQKSCDRRKPEGETFEDKL